MTGKFIAFEGSDANGKQTQSKLLAEKLDAYLVSFPRYETEIGKIIRANLYGQWWASLHIASVVNQPINVIVRQALFTLDRYDAAPDIIRALDSGRNVVADRYWLSGLVYGASDGVDAGMLERVHQCLPQPDAWVLLDVPVEESFRRRPERADVYERDRKKLEDVRLRYLSLFDEKARLFPASQKWRVINGVGTVEEVHARVLEAIK